MPDNDTASSMDDLKKSILLSGYIYLIRYLHGIFPYSSFFFSVKGIFVEKEEKEGDVLMITSSPLWARSQMSKSSETKC